MIIESFDGQRQNEKIVMSWRQHPWVLSRSALIVIVMVIIGSLPLALTSVSWAVEFLLLFIAVAGIYFVLVLYLWLSTIYILTNERILSISQSRLLIRSINEVPLRNIQNVAHVKKGLWQMLLDYGAVEIQTAGAATAMSIKNIEHPYRVQQRVLAVDEKFVESLVESK